MDKLKILYAAGEADSSKIQLARFLRAMKDKPYIIKIAAYKKSSPPIHIDWCLDALKNIFKPDFISLDNDNFVTYYEQVKYYNPDLIISDLEYYTSHIANILGTTLWQCSSLMINLSLQNDYKYNLGIYKKYAYLFNKNPTNIQRLVNMLDNSNCNFVYSHFGDTETPPDLKPNFEWIRPYHAVGKKSLLCQHNVIAASLGNNKKIISLLKLYPDSICFTESLNEHYENPNIKDVRNLEEFTCNLKNSKLFVCEGQTSFLADAFYNEKNSVVLTNFDEPECIVNSTISEKLNLSKSIYNTTENLTPLMNIDIPIHINEKIKFLHQKIEDL